MKINKIMGKIITPNIDIVKERCSDFKTEFTIKDDIYFFQARDEKEVYPVDIRYGWHLSFGKGYENDKYLPTNNNTPFKVLSAVRKSFDIFIDKYNPKKVSFVCEGDLKSKIYIKELEKRGYKITKCSSNLLSLTGETPYLYKGFK